jgi:hypothetical protein
MSRDPYRDRKPYHMAALVNPEGGVSSLCAARPRALNLKRETWTIRWEAVTCKKCLARRPAADGPEPTTEEP